MSDIRTYRHRDNKENKLQHWGIENVYRIYIKYKCTDFMALLLSHGEMVHMLNKSFNQRQTLLS